MQRKFLNSYKSTDKLYTDKYFTGSGIQIEELVNLELKDKIEKQIQRYQDFNMKTKQETNFFIQPRNKQWKGVHKQQEDRYQYKQRDEKYQSKQHRHQSKQQQQRYQWREEGKIDTRQVNYKKQEQEVMLYEQRQYIEYLEGLSLGELERQLAMMRQKERGYYKINYQLKVLQKKSKLLKDQTRKYNSRQATLCEEEEIAQIKSEIEEVSADIRSIADETKLIRTQSVESKEHLKCLQRQLDKLKEQNYNIQSNINQQTQKLFTQKKTIQHIESAQMQKQSEIDSIRKEIKELQKEAILLERQLVGLQEEKQSRQEKKQQLRIIVFQLQQNLLSQSQHQNELKLQLKNTHRVKDQFQNQLKLLRQQQAQLISLSQTKQQQYHKLLQTTQQSDREIINLKDELFIVQTDISELNRHFICQADLLKQQEAQNAQINNQFDALSQQAVQLWNSITQLIQIHTNKRQLNQIQTSEHYDNLNHNQTAQNHNSPRELKFKVLKLWNEIQQLIKINQNS